MFMAVTCCFAADGWTEGHRGSTGGAGASQRASGWAGAPDGHREMGGAGGATGQN